MEEEIKVKKKDIFSLLLKIVIAIICFMIFITLSTHFSMKIDLENMKKVYPEYDKKSYIYYKEDKEVVKIKRIEDIYGNDIKLKINKVPLMYCDNKNCIYINTSRSFERIYLNPKMYISILLVALFIFVAVLLNRMEYNKKKYIIIIIIFSIITGLSFIEEGFIVTKYYTNVNRNKNLEHGILIGEVEDKTYAYKYTVNNKMYYFNSPSKNDTIYYKKSNPSISYNKTNPINIGIIIVNIVYIVLIVILNKNRVKRISQGEAEEDK